LNDTPKTRKAMSLPRRFGSEFNGAYSARTVEVHSTWNPGSQQINDLVQLHSFELVLELLHR